MLLLFRVVVCSLLFLVCGLSFGVRCGFVVVGCLLLYVARCLPLLVVRCLLLVVV